MTKKSVRITKGMREQILPLLLDAVPQDQIAARFGITKRQLGGLISGLKNHGKLPVDAYTDFTESSIERFANRLIGKDPAASDATTPAQFPETLVGMEQAPTPAFLPPVPAPSGEPLRAAFRPRPPAPQYRATAGYGQQSPDDFEWRASNGSPEGLEFEGSEVQYEVERVVPYDGVLGRHPAPFGKDQLGKLYGSGRYQLTKYVPGTMPKRCQVQISGTYGPPRTPKTYEPEETKDSRQEQPDRRGPFDPSMPREFWGNRPFGMWPPAQPSGDVAKVAIEGMLRQLDHSKDGVEDQVKAERERSNETLRLEAERQRIRQEEREAEHRRELERIRAQAEADKARDERVREELKQLEEARLALVREQAELSNKRMESELERYREDVDAVHASVDVRMREHRDALDKEIQFRKEMVDLEKRLEFEKLDLAKQINTGDATSLLVTAAEKILNGIHATVKEITAVRRLELQRGETSQAPPADHGNVAPDEVARQEDAAAQPRAPGQNGNGHQKGGDEVKGVIDRILESELFLEIAREWALQIRAGCKPTTFANMYLEWMRDPADDAAKTRQACTAFANHMRPRAWADVREQMRAKLPPESVEAFDDEFAELFYDGFKTLVIEHIDMYHEEFLEHRMRQRAQREAARGAARTEAPSEEPVAKGE